MATAELHELQLLRPREAAELVGISLRQLDRFVKAKRIRPVKLAANGHRRFRITDLAALVSETKEEQ